MINTRIYSRLFFALISCTLFISKSIAQNNSNSVVLVDDCTDIISGNRHGHLTSMLACNVPLLITASENEEITGTIITGTFISNDKITITAGYKSVKILPANHFESDEENSTESTNETLTHGKTHIKVDPPTSGIFNEFKSRKTKSISIFPNPTNGLITISTDEKIKSILIYDQYATILLERTMKKSSNAQSLIDISEFNKGLYILKISLENGETFTEKIIKN